MKSAETEHLLNRKDHQRLLYRKTMAILVWIGLIVAAGHAPAADIPLPPVNLGDTGFEDGIAFPGWLVEETGGDHHGKTDVHYL